MRGTAAVLTVTMLAAVVLARAPGALAHRAKAGLTTVVWNERTSSLEIIHRLHVHDAREALVQVSDLARPDLGDLKARARLSLYVEEHFALALPDGEALTLELLGAELEGDYVNVYQEAAPESLPSALEVRCSFLQDVFADQVNTVNFELGGPVRTLVFTKDDGRQEITGR